MAEPERPSKRACQRDAAGGCDDDRLSALPDALLHSVMSFLTARQAVQTCALSRRWRRLWRSMPCLDIDDRDFCDFEGCAAAWGSTRRRQQPQSVPDPEVGGAWRRLEEFAFNLFVDHDAPALDRFRLRVGTRRRDQDVERWVRRGIRYHPAVVEIVLAFASATFSLPPLGPATAHRLRRLCLSRVRLDGGFAGHLRSRCPVLEDLELERCEIAFVEIVSSSIRCLNIHCCHYDSDKPRTVTAPALASLRLAFLPYARQDLFLLNGAPVGLRQASVSMVSGHLGYVDKNMFVLLGSLCNVRTLELWRFSSPTLVDDENEKFPEFPNLTTLLMGKCVMSYQFNLLRSFLKNVPNLEKVTLKHCEYSSERWIRGGLQRKLPARYQKLIRFKSQDLIGIKFKDTSISNLFGLLMAIRTKLEANTIILTKIYVLLEGRGT